MRLELESMCSLAESSGDLQELTRRFRDFDVVFSSHSAAEDDFIFPALATRGALLNTARAAQEHQEEVLLFRAVEDALREGKNPSSRLRFLKEKLSKHMLEEEDAIFPALSLFSDDELGRLVGLVMGSRPAEVLEATIRLEVAHLEAENARHVLSTMCQVAKNTAFKDWLECKFRNGFQPRAELNDKCVVAGQCPYYAHAAKVVAPCCGQLVCCRRCHDRQEVCPVAMDARAVVTMRCDHCALDQPLAQTCVGCGARVAAYFCDVCKLLDSTRVPTFHCPYCNICRRGHGLGVDYHHCMSCNMCIALDHLFTHPCDRQDQTHRTCAVCSADVFKSFDHVTLLPCGHPKHANCQFQPDQVCAHCQLLTTDPPLPRPRRNSLLVDDDDLMTGEDPL